MGKGSDAVKGRDSREERDGRRLGQLELPTASSLPFHPHPTLSTLREREHRLPFVDRSPENALPASPCI